MGLPTKNEHDNFLCPQNFIAYPQPHEILKCQIKYLSVISMIVDHVVSVFFTADAIPYILIKLLGRLAAPAMCFALVQGFIHTSNRRNYLSRLAIFAVLSRIPFAYYMSGSIWFLTGNMLFTMVCSFLLLQVVESKKQLGVLAIPLAIIILYASTFTDWFIFGPLFTLFFYLNRGNKDLQALCHVCITFLSLGYSAYMCMQHSLHSILKFGKLEQSCLSQFYIFIMVN